MSRTYFKLSKPRHAQGTMVFNRRSIVRIQDQDDITELPEIDFNESNEAVKAATSNTGPEMKDAQSTSADFLGFDGIGTTRRFHKEEHELDLNFLLKKTM